MGIDSVSAQLESDLDKVRAILGDLPEPVLSPAFVIISGLPGSGKSYFSRKLSERYSCCVIESDAIRKVLFHPPDYSLEESAYVFKVCHKLIEEFLQKGIPVILDATNLSEYNREKLYNIGEKTGAIIILVYAHAPEEVVQKRLKLRKESVNLDDKSDADLSVYYKMKQELQPIKRNFLFVDTSKDIGPAIDKVLKIIKRHKK